MVARAIPKVSIQFQSLMHHLNYNESRKSVIWKLRLLMMRLWKWNWIPNYACFLTVVRKISQQSGGKPIGKSNIFPISSCRSSSGSGRACFFSSAPNKLVTVIANLSNEETDSCSNEDSQITANFCHTFFKGLLETNSAALLLILLRLLWYYWLSNLATSIFNAS